MSFKIIKPYSKSRITHWFGNFIPDLLLLETRFKNNRCSYSSCQYVNSSLNGNIGLLEETSSITNKCALIF